MEIKKGGLPCTGCPTKNVTVSQGCHFVCIWARLSKFLHNVANIMQLNVLKFEGNRFIFIGDIQVFIKVEKFGTFEQNVTF